jgi:hypothetical protein
LLQEHLRRVHFLQEERAAVNRSTFGQQARHAGSDSFRCGNVTSLTGAEVARTTNSNRKGYTIPEKKLLTTALTVIY